MARGLVICMHIIATKYWLTIALCMGLWEWTDFHSQKPLEKQSKQGRGTEGGNPKRSAGEFWSGQQWVQI